MNHFKSVYGHNFFVKPADQNYFLARWLKINAIHQEFHWQAAQALEKYFKACLVMNDVSVKNLAHDLNKLLKSFNETFKGICLLTLEKPKGLHQDFWRDESVEVFIQRMNALGQPDSRYGLVSWNANSDDMFKLDQICFHLRRCSIGLDWIVGEDWNVEGILVDFKGKLYSDVLRAKTGLQIRGDMEVPDRKANIAGKKLSDTLYAWNFALNRSESDIKKAPPLSIYDSFEPFENSYLSFLWEDMAHEQSPPNQYTINGVDWLLKMMRLPNDARKELENWLNTQKSI